MPEIPHQVSHEVLLCAFVGENLLSKPQVQITFTPHGEATHSLRQPTAKVLALTASKSEEWWLFVPQELVRLLELPFPDILGVWAEKNPPGLP
jgi:hypothetical protein